MLNLNQTDNYKDYLGKFLFIISLFILGLMVFLIIQKPFLHIDEWFTKGLLTLSFRDMVHVTAGDVHPPLYYATVWVPVKILNLLHIKFDKIVVMKMMSVLPYVILCIISFTKIRKDYGWLACGLFTFTLIAMSSFFTVFSIARMYPLGILLLVCGFIAAGDILKEPKLKSWIILTMTAIMGAYTHYFVAFSFIVLYILLLLHIMKNNKTQLKNWIISAVYGIICFIPWMFILYRQTIEDKGGNWSNTISLDAIFEFFSSVFSGSSDLIIQIIGVAIFLAVFIFVVLRYRKSPKENEFILLGFLVLIGTILSGIIAAVLFRTTADRYLIPATAVLWLSISILISRLDFKKVAIPVVIVLLLFGAVNLYGQIDEISKNHDKLVKDQEFLKSINNNDSVVIITSKVKFVHFYNELKNGTVYEDYTIDERQGARDWARIYDNKTSKFMIPDDVNYYKGKNIYIAYRDDGSKLDLPSGYSLEPVGRVENCQFSKLLHTSK